ncbi:hypothetical protein AaE_008076 [Aphanomyces astaci]|uniref:Uncharacterized protein n=1 Tax=Aphanomyces astaci TaxID=112090 RepID=A0A6A5A8D4_APHAT|nr:hypothetical protein AaE_008076 [Aphanomyces astaci]
MATRRRPSSTTPSLGDVRSTKTHEMSTKKTKKQCSRVLTCQKVKLQVYTLKYDDASVYVGEIHIESRQRHGKGVFRTSHGDVLDGQWSDDRFHGFDDSGILRSPTIATKACITRISGMGAARIFGRTATSTLASSTTGGYVAPPIIFRTHNT